MTIVKTILRVWVVNDLFLERTRLCIEKWDVKIYCYQIGLCKCNDFSQHPSHIAGRLDIYESNVWSLFLCFGKYDNMIYFSTKLPGFGITLSPPSSLSFMNTHIFSDWMIPRNTAGWEVISVGIKYIDLTLISGFGWGAKYYMHAWIKRPTNSTKPAFNTHLN